MAKNFTNFAFTDSVKAEQEVRGSRISYARMEEKDQFKLSLRETNFIDQQHGFYMSTVGENGWPYVQFRGGPTGFLKTIDSQALAYADFSGNMQYISTGNLKSTKKVALILLDYSTRTRLKIWAETEILDPDENPDLLEIVSDPSYKAKAERIIVFHIKGFDWNCPQHITPKFTIDQMKDLVKQHPDLLEELSKV
ncbi:pyridoxamine 5'-phosphate oxidase family protein [Roseivirga sp. E12]|uniref:pyridoxamine 5'-phosphate oxidase family protein n=1 Tax=Roseivirga sp. E12 TaxID=2819237 RepID=UPI001ABCBC99|nr:pyridoxamine 5'-phosphate oxidase family protein [Roseivirga sp. E12]MBO3700622.1 pyridoxamine 5'-phosphate oxidase family protein [Roseivirga sp. E12]